MSTADYFQSTPLSKGSFLCSRVEKNSRFLIGRLTGQMIFYRFLRSRTQIAKESSTVFLPAIKKNWNGKRPLSRTQSRVKIWKGYCRMETDPLSDSYFKTVRISDSS